MDTFNFKEEVLEISNEIPVVVEFWAPWCEPCRMLTAIMEELAPQYDGRWLWVKINADEHPQILMQYGIKGIPAVKMFIQGKVISGFTGALPKSMVQKWLDGNLPDERKAQFAAIRENLATSQRLEAMIELEMFVRENPDFWEASVVLAREKVFDQPDTAARILKNIGPGHRFYAFAYDVRTISEWIGFTDPSNHRCAWKIKASQVAFDDSNLDAALELLIDAIPIDPEYSDGLALRTCNAVFRILGENHRITRKYKKLYAFATRS